MIKKTLAIACATLALGAATAPAQAADKPGRFVANRKVCDPPQQNPATDSSPDAAGRARTYSAAACRSAVTRLGSRL